MKDGASLKLHLTPYREGLFVLAAPVAPGEADEVGSDDLGRIIDMLATDFRYVVVDTDGGLGERTLTVLERATDYVFVCATDVLSVRGLAKEIEALDLIGMTTARRHFVLNRADARVGLDNEDIALERRGPLHHAGAQLAALFRSRSTTGHRCWRRPRTHRSPSR